MSTEHLYTRQELVNESSTHVSNHASNSIMRRTFLTLAVLLGGAALYAQRMNPDFIQKNAYKIARVFGGPSETTAIDQTTNSIKNNLSQDLEYKANAQTWALVEDGATKGTEQERVINMVIQRKNGEPLLEIKYFVTHKKEEKFPTGFGGYTTSIDNLPSDTKKLLQDALMDYSENSKKSDYNLVELIYKSGGKWNSDSEYVKLGLEKNLPEISDKFLDKILEDLNNVKPFTEQLSGL